MKGKESELWGGPSHSQYPPLNYAFLLKLIYGFKQEHFLI